MQKYGGTSVASVEKILSCAENIRNAVRAGKKVIAVVSAMGKQTDELLGLAHQITKKPSQRELDILLSAGERVTMALFSIALNDMDIPSISLTGSQVGIITDTQHGNAKIERILGDRVRVAFESIPVVIVAGFQGVSKKKKDITTLGRGGSDLTAIALAKEFSAEACELYKDVNGICSADPRIVKKTKLLENLSYKTLCQLTWQGSGIIHARGAHLANKFKIPLEVRSSINLNTPGTKIGNFKNMESSIVYAISHQDNLVDASFKNVKISLVQKTLWERNLQALLITENSDNSVRVICNKTGIEALSFLSSAEIHKEQLAALSIVGEGFWQEFSVIETVESQIKDLDYKFIESKNDLINVIIESKHLNKVINELHTKLINEA